MYEVSQYGGNGSLDDNQCINTGLSSINIIGFTGPGNMNGLDGAMYDTQIARIQHTKAMSLVLLKSAKMSTKQATTLVILDHGSTRRVWEPSPFKVCSHLGLGVLHMVVKDRNILGWKMIKELV